MDADYTTRDATLTKKGAYLQAKSERYLDTAALFLAMGEGPSTSSNDLPQDSHP